MSVDNKILERVKKLLALANSSNEHEAEMAATKAHELLVRHNLSMEDTVRDLDPILDERVDRRTFKETEANFVDSILVDHFFVQVYTCRRKGPLWGQNNSPPTWFETCTQIVGRKENVEIARYIRVFLIRTFRALWREQRRMGAPPIGQRGYYAGLAKGLRSKLEVQTKKVQTEYGLVIVPDPKLEEMLESLNLKESKGRALQDAELYDKGVEDGKKIQIRRGLEDKAENSQKALGPSNRPKS